MPSFNSAVQICNYALAAIGHATSITSLSESSTAATRCNLVYNRDRISLLEDHDWAFARKNVTLSEISTDPPVYWQYAYQMPGDIIRSIAIYDTSWRRQEDTRRIDYERGLVTVGGNDYNVIYTDLQSAKLVYTKDVEDPTRFPQSFVDALYWRIAASICLPMTGDQGMAQQVAERAAMALTRAQQLDNDEGEDSTDWWTAGALEARG